MTTPRRIKDRFFHGFFVLLAGHALLVIAYFVLREIESPGSGPIPNSFFLLVTFGLVQFLYVIPALIFAGVRRRPKLAVSLIIGALMTSAINAAFAYFVFSGGPLVP